MKFIYSVLLLLIGCGKFEQEKLKIIDARQCTETEGEITFFDIKAYRFNLVDTPDFFDCMILSDTGPKYGYSNKACEVEFEDGRKERYTFDSIVRTENGTSNKINLLNSNQCKKIELTPEESEEVVAKWGEYYCDKIISCT